MKHLFLVSQHCEVNLMEPKNLAIIFGPSVVRTSNETLETVVKDMKHQCRIVEALVSHVKKSLSSQIVLHFPFNWFLLFFFCSINIFSKMKKYQLLVSNLNKSLQNLKQIFSWIMFQRLNVSFKTKIFNGSIFEFSISIQK